MKDFVIVVDKVSATPDPTRHNYIKKLVQLGLTTGVHDLSIRHDSWCAIYRGDYCNCNPFIISNKTGKRLA